MKRFMISHICKVIACVCLAIACVSCGNSQKPRVSPLDSEARQRGEEAAVWIIDTFHNEKSRLKLEGAILRVKAMQSEYILMGDTLAAEAFDESFVSYIRQNNDSIANLLFD